MAKNTQIVKKNKYIAAVLAFALGGLGIHRFYLGKSGPAISLMLITVFGWLLVAAGVGWLIILGSYIWRIYDCIMILSGGFKDSDGKFVRNWQTD